MLPEQDLTAIVLTIKLAAVTTVILLAIGTPLAWWLAHTRNRGKALFEAIVALPLVLPPTVLGFYLLLAFSPTSPFGQFWLGATGTPLAFSFSALVIGSVLYSLPFVIQPLQTSFEQLPKKLFEAASTMGASFKDQFISLVLPQCKRSFITAASLGFAHTIGEFGVVLMIGGNIPGETQVLSISLYDKVESLQYSEAHWLAGGLVIFSLLLLAFIYSLKRGDAKSTRVGLL
ncbi:MAG: molybdate ABC transporter permease subunit [Oceanicoccus sp.]|uniref:molybdate ABC transporter permease subunit n=1 Tax=Oceanicoccus sp. TaxID=2691044 RepID=UPI00261C6938|nr:molybdate ABC transporter permease subunit [Oceanicoccus sp.]MCP3907062.1 molybdate ABC transporter permease subunit [Oceanicoccus sp.]